VYASDITYIDTMEGWLYLAVILDLRSRRVAGWSTSQSLEETIVLDALPPGKAGQVKREGPRPVRYPAAGFGSLVASALTSSPHP
jgi:transposase InsO family protein